ncbi:hypothetical protein HD806DRAFT_70452 [Xylariaceae sp. AK1471]|nr:hypothetical protein HD806DRAFT_70452 [Xylariaceae sp. AK1471]
MAPSSKGTNPAPNYTVTMNRVQTQIEAQLRIVRSFMPSRPPVPAPAPTTAPNKSITPSFSTLASASTPKPPLLSTSTRKNDEENLFAESRAQDPNTGLGFGASSTGSKTRNGDTATQKERETQVLRGRLLGRKRGAEDRTTMRRAERQESSDEEAGRGGLGRAKKRARRDEPQEEEEERDQPITTEMGALESKLEDASATESKDDVLRNDKVEGGDGDVRDEEGAAPLLDGSVSKGSEGNPEQKKKKRKKKKKKGNSKETEGES